ncbi:MAG: hypothetical protein CMH52_01975 [Myxococcales bacterium]|nr:hypothetical protein [Myxococcales bacterium]
MAVSSSAQTDLNRPNVKMTHRFDFWLRLHGTERWKSRTGVPRCWITCEGLSFECKRRHEVGCRVWTTLILLFGCLAYLCLFLRHLVTPDDY